MLRVAVHIIHDQCFHFRSNYLKIYIHVKWLLSGCGWANEHAMCTSGLLANQPEYICFSASTENWQSADWRNICIIWFHGKAGASCCHHTRSVQNTAQTGNKIHPFQHECSCSGADHHMGGFLTNPKYGLDCWYPSLNVSEYPWWSSCAFSLARHKDWKRFMSSDYTVFIH